MTPEAGRYLEMLAAAPDRLAAASAGVPAQRLRQAPAEGEWSANDVLAHLRACADVWGGAVATILAEDAPAIRAVNPRTWMERTDYLDLDFAPSLRSFATQRAGLLGTLESLSDDGWARSATVTGAGKTLRRTVLSYTEWIAVHERPHLKQIERAILAVTARSGSPSAPAGPERPRRAARPGRPSRRVRGR